MVTSPLSRRRPAREVSATSELIVDGVHVVKEGELELDRSDEGGGDGVAIRCRQRRRLLVEHAPEIFDDRAEMFARVQIDPLGTPEVFVEVFAEAFAVEFAEGRIRRSHLGGISAPERHGGAVEGAARELSPALIRPLGRDEDREHLIWDGDGSMMGSIC